MRRRRTIAGGILLAALLTTTPSHGQTQDQFDRLDVLARYAVTLAVCEKLGMGVVPDAGQKIEAGIAKEASSWGLSPERYKEVSGAAVKRQSRIIKIDNEAALAASKTEAGLRNVRSYFTRHGATCLNAAADPLFRQFVSVPVGFNLDAAATNAADGLLAGGGLASWQTPAIQARGDLMMAAGACRRHIGPNRSDAIFQTNSRVGDPRERAYYVASYDEGLNDTELNFDAVQCERLIARLQKKVATAK